MLHPVSPSHIPAGVPAGQQNTQPSSSDGQSSGTSSKKPGGSLFQWVSAKELVFVFVVCSFGVLLFRAKDEFQFVLSWDEKLDISNSANSKFPVDDEKLPPPIVSDLDSNGDNDMIFLTYNNELKLFTFPTVANPYKLQESKKTLGYVGYVNLDEHVTEGVKPVAMATGYLQKYQSMVQVRHQVITLLMADWTVLCLDHNLKLLWKVNVEDKDMGGLLISEATIMVSTVAIHKGDYGSVLLGGREFETQTEESLNRMKRVLNKRNEEEVLKSLGHYTMYALEGRGGEVRWHHKPEDFQISPAYSPEASSFHHLKLLMFKHSQQHYGEVSWHQYSSAIRDTLPHTWQQSSDTHFSLAHFRKDKRKSEKSDIADHISKVSDLTLEHISGLAFGGQQPHSPSEHVEDPNVLILHTVKGVEVVHLYQGRPLCSLSLSPYHSSHADINGDGVIDHISAVHNPGEAGFSENQRGGDCYGKATPINMDSKSLFKHSICKATHWTENFIAVDKWMPQLNTVGRKKTDNTKTEPLAPILLPSSFHSAPLKLHMGGLGWDINSFIKGLIGAPSPNVPSFSSLSSSVETLYDSVFVISSGRVTSIGPHGEFNWQVDTPADWDSASNIIYDPSHPSWNSEPEMVDFVHNSFTPSAQAFSSQAYGKKDHILIMGWNSLVLLSGEEGATISYLRFPDCNPVYPIQVVDFTGDGWNDIIITCPDRYWGFSLVRKSGFWQTTLLSVFIGVVIVMFAVYTRQRTLGLLPPVKTALD